MSTMNDIGLSGSVFEKVVIGNYRGKALTKDTIFRSMIDDIACSSKVDSLAGVAYPLE